ncbi:MAG: peptidase U32 family protein [Christensenellales bacterium]
MKKPELLAPAGDMEKLETALYFGADAVYFSGNRLTLRAFSANFDDGQIKKAIDLVHDRGKKAYVALNAIAHNRDLPGLSEDIGRLSAFEADGVIVSDLGIIRAIRQTAPELDVHLSVQASCCNSLAANAYYELGVRRIILSRELSLEEIRQIRRETPRDLKLEVFVHGAMCMAYSGRCHLSHVMTGRDANAGACAQPCRWRYGLVEEKRPGVYYPIEQDGRGSYVLSARDLCMIRHIRELREAGVDSFKIEGRMKSVYYVGNVVNAYRRAIDGTNDEETLYRELEKSSHRPYDTGFFFGRPDSDYDVGAYEQDYDFVAVVREYDAARGRVVVEQRNAFSVGDCLELLSPHSFGTTFSVEALRGPQGERLERAILPQQEVSFDCEETLRPMDILRRRRK